MLCKQMSTMPNMANDDYDLRVVTLEGERVNIPAGYRFGMNSITYSQHIPDDYALELLKEWMTLELMDAMESLSKTGRRITELKLCLS